MKYIPYKALKLLAFTLHQIYSLTMPKYGKHGHRKITIPQKMTVITIVKAFGYTYRDAPVIAADIGDIIGIENTTTHQNYHAYAKKMDTFKLQDIAEAIGVITVKLHGKSERIILVDSTGFQIMDASAYYRERSQRKADFFKLHVAMDMETRTIMVSTPSDRYLHDINPFKDYFISRLAELAEEFDFKVKVVSGDSAYASEETYEMVRRELKATPALKPAARRGKPRRGIYAVFWRMRNLPWMRKFTNYRCVLETSFKTFKRLFTDHVKSKTVDERVKELIYKVMVWNILALIKVYMEASTWHNNL